MSESFTAINGAFTTQFLPGPTGLVVRIDDDQSDMSMIVPPDDVQGLRAFLNLVVPELSFDRPTQAQADAAAVGRRDNDQFSHPAGVGGDNEEIWSPAHAPTCRRYGWRGPAGKACPSCKAVVAEKGRTTASIVCECGQTVEVTTTRAPSPPSTSYWVAFEAMALTRGEHVVIGTLRDKLTGEAVARVRHECERERRYPLTEDQVDIILALAHPFLTSKDDALLADPALELLRLIEEWRYPQRWVVMDEGKLTYSDVQRQAVVTVLPEEPEVEGPQQ